MFRLIFKKLPKGLCIKNETLIQEMEQNNLRKIFVIKCFIIYNNCFLLVRRASSDNNNPSTWTLPGGKVLTNEIPEKAAVREAKEETNLDIEVLKLNTQWDFKAREPNTKIIGKTFLCKPKTDSVGLSSEFADYKWVSLDAPVNEVKLSWLKKEISTYKGSRKTKII